MVRWARISVKFFATLCEQDFLVPDVKKEPHNTSSRTPLKIKTFVRSLYWWHSEKGPCEKQRLMNMDKAKELCQDRSKWGSDLCLPLWEIGVTLCTYVRYMVADITLKGYFRDLNSFSGKIFFMYFLLAKYMEYFLITDEGIKSLR